MKIRSRIACLALILNFAIAGSAFAHEPAVKIMPVYVQDIAPAAMPAIRVVDAFTGAIQAAKFDAAAKLLDPKVSIFESGNYERSRDEYMSHHAIADAAFLKNAELQQRYRQAQIVGKVAWVATQILLHTVQDGKDIVLLSTETMLLKKTTAGWKIVHIHWSSHPA